MHYNAMPGTLRYLDTILSLSGANTEPGHFSKLCFVYSRFAIMYRPSSIYIRQLFVEDPIQTPFQTDDRFRSLQVPMDRNMRTWFQHIQHPLRRIIRCRAQVVVLPETLTLPCLPMQHRKQVIIDQLNLHNQKIYNSPLPD